MTKSSSSDPGGLTELLDHFLDSTEGQDKVQIGDLLDSLSSRSHGPMLLFPAVIAISPIGMIPGMSVVTGTLIILIASQMFLFSDRPWIPKWLQNFGFPRKKLKNGVEKSRPWARFFGKFIGRRFEFLASGFMIYPVAILSILLAISFYPLAIVPFGVFVPGTTIALFALGLTAKDGLLVGLGIAATAAVPVLLFGSGIL